jgi:hypothetical protein
MNDRMVLAAAWTNSACTFQIAVHNPHVRAVSTEAREARR